MFPIIIFEAWCQCPEQTNNFENEFIPAAICMILLLVIVYNFISTPLSDGCLHGSNKITMENGVHKRCDEIVKGDIVLLANNELARVVCVAKILNTVYNKINLIQFPCGLIITEYHPIKIKRWIFPRNITTSTPYTEKFDAVYSFLLEKDDGSQVQSGLLIQGIECAPLGHNIQGEVIGHDFFGNFNAVRDALISVNREQYNNGLVEITHMERGPDEHVCGFVYRK